MTKVHTSKCFGSGSESFGVHNFRFAFISDLHLFHKFIVMLNTSINLFLSRRFVPLLAHIHIRNKIFEWKRQHFSLLSISLCVGIFHTQNIFRFHFFSFFLSLYDLSMSFTFTSGTCFYFLFPPYSFSTLLKFKSPPESQSFLQKVFHCTYFGVRGERDSFIMWRKMGFFFHSCPAFPPSPVTYPGHFCPAAPNLF